MRSWPGSPVPPDGSSRRARPTTSRLPAGISSASSFGIAGAATESALELTRQRLAWISERADEAYYFSNARNRVSVDLHRQLGFVEVTRDFAFPDASFEEGEGILFRVDLTSSD